MKTIEPHTPEWFSVLARVNPRQAILTRQITQLAGTLQCCSICGDTEQLTDYELSQAGLRYRLCADCKQLQQRYYHSQLRRAG